MLLFYTHFSCIPGMSTDFSKEIHNFRHYLHNVIQKNLTLPGDVRFSKSLYQAKVKLALKKRYSLSPSLSINELLKYRFPQKNE